MSKPHTKRVDKRPNRNKERAGAGKQNTSDVAQRNNSSSALRPLSWPLSDIVSLCAQNFIPANELALSSSELGNSQSRICGAWIEVLPTLINKREDYILHSAIRAFGTSILASGCDGRASVSEALEAQCEALHLLRGRIGQSNISSFNELAAAIMCLFLSEVRIIRPGTSSLLIRRL